MVLWGVGAVQVSKGQTAAGDSVGQERLPSMRPYLVIGDNDKFWSMDIHNLPKAPAVQRVDLLWKAVQMEPDRQWKKEFAEQIGLSLEWNVIKER